MTDFLMATHIASRTTFVAELARKGSRKINYSAMPAVGPGGDVLVSPHKVPLEIRRAAKAVLIGVTYLCGNRRFDTEAKALAYSAAVWRTRGVLIAVTRKESNQ
jgi:hypothetical protein